MKFHQQKFIVILCSQIIILSFLFISICKANNGLVAVNTETPVTSVQCFDDPEENMVVAAAKKKATQIGYDVKKFKTSAFFHGHDCTVLFFFPKSDICKLKVYLHSNTGKVFYIEEMKNSKWAGHK